MNPADQLKDGGVVLHAISRYDPESVRDALAQVTSHLPYVREKGAGKLCAPGARVLVKPNFVTHANQGSWGIEPLITHETVVKAAVDLCLKSGAAEVLVGDAPIQGCDFATLLDSAHLRDWSQKLLSADPRFRGIRDFRRTISIFESGVRSAREHLSSIDNYVLFDLANDSLLEPITKKTGDFRVTCYDPSLLARTHAPGVHQYLIAREVLEADLVINLPKLKTHKKAGVTCALKNLIGVNGNKEFLPHHRRGGTANGGDCYPGDDVVKRIAESALDMQNSARSQTGARLFHSIATQCARVSRRLGDNIGVEGSWAGNDTIWRTAMDINRIVLYGRTDASMADVPQRTVIHITDAIVAGQGDGPLAPEPLRCGLLLAAANAAAMDWIAAQILGYDPHRVPLVREAFGNYRWPLASFTNDQVKRVTTSDSARASFNSATPIRYPAGWVSATRNGDAAQAEVLSEQEA